VSQAQGRTKTILRNPIWSAAVSPPLLAVYEAKPICPYKRWWLCCLAKVYFLSSGEPELEYKHRAARMKTSIAIYPGSFDPVTNGHLDLIERGEKMFDLLIVAVLRNTEKAPLFSITERVEMLREVTRQWSSVEVEVFDGLLVDYARKRHAGVILRGIRAISDYEYELQMALMNRKLEPRLETVFMLPGETYSYLSSKLVREIAQLGGPLQGLVPPVVEERLRAKIS
jgi:pantetheine-phosphate adenylyltransferase